MDQREELDPQTADVERVNGREERTGDVLGLGSGPAPKMPGDPSVEHDPESVAKRRERMRSGDDEGVAGRTSDRTGGATGADMGAGGSGTDVTGG